MPFMAKVLVYEINSQITEKVWNVYTQHIQNFIKLFFFASWGHKKSLQSNLHVHVHFYNENIKPYLSDFEWVWIFEVKLRPVKLYVHVSCKVYIKSPHSQGLDKFNIANIAWQK